MRGYLLSLLLLGSLAIAVGVTPVCAQVATQGTAAATTTALPQPQE